MMNSCISFGGLYPIFRALLHINGQIEAKPFLRASVGLNQTLNRKYHDQPVHFSRVGISGTTAKSPKRKFKSSSHQGPFAVVASSQKSQTKVGTLACFDFL